MAEIERTVAQHPWSLAQFLISCRSEHERVWVLESGTGAVAGFAVCQRCILVQFADRLEQLPEVAALKDAKTRLQEYLQSHHESLPEYTITETSGDAHARLFKVVCVLNDMNIPSSHGQGKSRRYAEQDAAEKMLARLVAG